MEQSLTPYEIKVYAIGKVKLDLENKVVTVDDVALPKPLTDQEFKVFWFLAGASYKDQRRSFTAIEVWAGAWPHERDLTPTRTFEREISNKVSKHISEIRTKLVPVQIIEDKTYRIGQRVRDATPPEPIFLTLHRVFICMVAATAVTVCVDSPTRALLAIFDATIAQSSSMGLWLGFLQGILGSFFWSVGVALPLFCFWFLVDQFRPWTSRFAWVRGTAVAGVAGTVVGLFISTELLRGLYPDSRAANGWVLHASDPLRTAFTKTRLGYTEPWFGLLIGASVAFTILWIVSRPSWAELLLCNSKITHLHEAWSVFRKVAVLGGSWSLAFMFPIMLLGAWAFVLWLPIPPPDIENARILPQRVIGEALCIAVGGISFVIGTLIALYSMTKGIDVSGDDLCSMYRTPGRDHSQLR